MANTNTNNFAEGETVHDEQDGGFPLNTDFVSLKIDKQMKIVDLEALCGLEFEKLLHLQGRHAIYETLCRHDYVTTSPESCTHDTSNASHVSSSEGVIPQQTM